jgi:hypothetical protein
LRAADREGIRGELIEQAIQTAEQQSLITPARAARAWNALALEWPDGW